MKSLFFVILVVCLLPVSLMGTTFNVPTTEYPDIKSAITVSAHWDTIMLAPGTYTGVGNKNVVITNSTTIIGNGGPSDVVIDCENTDIAFVIYYNTILRNISIVNAKNSAVDNYGGIDMYNCIISNTYGHALYNHKWANIYDSVIKNTHDTGSYAGAIRCMNYSSLLLQNTLMENNVSDDEGGCIGSDSAYEIIINNCLLLNNTAENGGALYVILSNTTINNTVIANNEAEHCGGGIYADGGILTLNGCTVTNNSGVVTHGPGINASTLVLNHTIVWGNIPGSDIRCSSSFTASCSDYAGMPVTGDNISIDPMFCLPSNNNFMLDEYSPCLTGPCGQIGVYGLGCRSTIATEKSSWGKIKSMYK